MRNILNNMPCFYALMRILLFVTECCVPLALGRAVSYCLRMGRQIASHGGFIPLAHGSLAGSRQSRLLSLSLFAMQSLSLSRPSFPPMDDALAALQRINWRSVADRALSALLLIVAIVHALSVRLWAERGRLAPMLRRLAAALNALADRLPEPLSADSPRQALLSALIAAGQDTPSMAKANRSVLLRRARQLGLIA